MCYSNFNNKINKNKSWLKEGFTIRNIIPDFTKIELEYIVGNANFTKDEKKLFFLRNNEHSLEECAEIMVYSISTINRINKRMKRKIIKVICKSSRYEKTSSETVVSFRVKKEILWNCQIF